MLGFVKVIITKAWADCHSLDTLLEDRGEAKGFREFYAIFDDQTALEAIHRVAYLNYAKPYAGKQPRYELMRAGDHAAMRKNTMHDMRELLRDKWPPDAALGILGPVTDPETFRELGKILDEFHRRPHRFERTPAQWIERGWMSLRFYECAADGVEAYERGIWAAELLGLDQVSERQFLRAWQNVRSRVFGNANPVFSQSAGAT